MVSKCMYDVMCASPGTITPLRYELNYRNYYLVTQGTIKIRLIAPHASKYLYPVIDYDNFEFRSPVNPWRIQAEYRADFDKIKTMDVELRAGQIIYIPAYWWCSMQFPASAGLTTICCFKYRTYMNTVSILDKLCMWLLQQQNVKRDIIEKKITATAEPTITETNDSIVASTDIGVNVNNNIGATDNVIGSS